MSQTSMWNCVSNSISCIFFSLCYFKPHLFLSLLWFLGNFIIEKLTSTTFSLSFSIICFTWYLVSSSSKRGIVLHWGYSTKLNTKISALIYHVVECYAMLSCIWLFATLWTVACQAPLSMGFSRQYWSGLPFPSPKHQHISLSYSYHRIQFICKEIFLKMLSVESIKGEISSQFLKLEIMTDPTTYRRKF